MTAQVVAYAPTELAAAQQTVRSWCAENIRRLLMQKRDAEENVQTALTGKFNSKPFRAQVRRCERRITFYKKIGKAIKLGYMIIPNFDLDLFAVRTAQRKPRKQITTSRWESFQQEGQQLPEGEGRYVSDIPIADGYLTYEDSKGNEREKFWATEFADEISFPTSLIKPQIVKETRKAMGFKLFDQVGVARGRYTSARRDPIVGARIIDPTRVDKAVTFFISWWFDESDL